MVEQRKIRYAKALRLNLEEQYLSDAEIDGIIKR